MQFKLRAIINKKVAFSCHANRMKPFVDPNLRPIDPTEPYINESDIPKDRFEPISVEANPKDTDLHPVVTEMPLSLPTQKEKESNVESDLEKTESTSKCKRINFGSIFYR